ncbi:helix-turn-helix transcriptional regulator [Thalassospiraceae bacterium LMO-SO8]|nr:helix-turn-helix transcriptional regulator [Alphaproteobacteria bacterium LMO-S08]WND77045.1 helix-turn-helix transcriptional regulator [Thalassospiraceae bacterium LMO-SO8]
MNSSAIIPDVAEKMAEQKVTQSELAVACGLSQGHISNVLNNKVKLGNKTKDRLMLWLEEGASGESREIQLAILELAGKLGRHRPSKRMQIMELLKAIEQVVGR